MARVAARRRGEAAQSASAGDLNKKRTKHYRCSFEATTATRIARLGTTSICMSQRSPQRSPGTCVVPITCADRVIPRNIAPHRPPTLHVRISWYLVASDIQAGQQGGGSHPGATIAQRHIHIHNHIAQSGLRCTAEVYSMYYHGQKRRPRVGRHTLWVLCHVSPKYLARGVSIYFVHSIKSLPSFLDACKKNWKQKVDLMK